MSSRAINVDESNQEFELELERHIILAKNPKNRISLAKAKKDILKNYQKLASTKV